MARSYKYFDFASHKLLFETVQPNYVSEEDVNKMFKKETGRDYLYEKARIDREIRVVENK